MKCRGGIVLLSVLAWVDVSSGFGVLYPQDGQKVFGDSVYVDLEWSVGVHEDTTAVEITVENPEGQISKAVRPVDTLPRLSYQAASLPGVPEKLRELEDVRLIPDVFVLSTLKPGMHKIWVQQLSANGDRLLDVETSSFRVVMPWIQIQIPDSVHYLDTLSATIEFSPDFELGKDGQVLLVFSSSGAKWVNETSTGNTLNVNVRHFLPGRGLVFAILVTNQQQPRNIRKAVAVSDFNSFRVLSLKGPENARFPHMSEWMHSPRVLLPPDDMYIGVSVEHYGVWSLSEAQLFQQIMDVEIESLRKEGEEQEVVFVDVGANIGSFTIPLAKHLKDKAGRVVALEAHRKAFAYLSANVLLAGIDNAELLNYVVSNENADRVEQGVDDELPDNGGVYSFEKREVKFGEAIYDAEESLRESKGTTVKPAKRVSFWRKLDTILEENFPEGVGHIGLVKLDIEGFELEALQGFSNTLGLERPVVCFEADRLVKLGKVVELLDEFDYALYWSFHPIHQAQAPRNRDVNIFGKTLSLNILAVPQEKVRLYESSSIADALAPELKVDMANIPLVDLNFNRHVTLLDNLQGSEFSQWSPNGEDGVLLQLFMDIGVTNKEFIELVSPVNTGWTNTMYGRGRFTKALEFYMKWSGDQVDVSSPDFYRNLPQQPNKAASPDLLVAVQTGVDLDILCSLLCGAVCLNGKCSSEREKKWFFTPRVVLARATEQTDVLTCKADKQGVESLAPSLHAMARTTGFFVVYCESNGMTCMLVDEETFNWQYLNASQRKTLEDRFSVERVVRKVQPNGYTSWCE